MNCNIPNNCPDCVDLHARDIAHNCHCHAPIVDLPNLSSLLGDTVISVFYIRDQKTSKVKGIKIMTQNNMTLSINLDRDELDIEYAGSV